jgi:protein-tyrosine phosphatase
MNIINNTNPCDEILPNLYLGSIKALGTYEYKSIDYYMVVDLIKHTFLLEKPKLNSDKYIYINLPVHDSPDECENLLSLINETKVLEKMHLALQQNKPVLVHCFAGMQRSCALVACYLIKYHNMLPYEAIAYIKFKRPIAFFGKVNFMDLLLSF